VKRASKSRAIVKRRPRLPVKRHTALARVEAPTVAETIEKVLIQGDLTPLSTEQRLEYYKAVCKSLGLNPLTRPFDYIYFRETDDAPAKLVLYALRNCTDQLRKIHRVSVLSCKTTTDGEYINSETLVRDATGRTDTGLGVVPLSQWSKKQQKSYSLSGLALANARMKCETKAKRRATLSLCGLGILDVSELDTLQRGVDYFEVTPSGRIVMEPGEERRSLEAATEEYDAHNEHLKKFEEREAEEFAKTQAVPCLFYTLHPESETYEITGNEELKKAHRELLIPFWSGNARTIICKPEDLGKLISQFEKLKVPFRELKRA